MLVTLPELWPSRLSLVISVVFLAPGMTVMGEDRGRARHGRARAGTQCIPEVFRRRSVIAWVMPVRCLGEGPRGNRRLGGGWAMSDMTKQKGGDAVEAVACKSLRDVRGRRMRAARTAMSRNGP